MKNALIGTSIHLMDAEPGTDLTVSSQLHNDHEGGYINISLGYQVQSVSFHGSPEQLLYIARQMVFHARVIEHRVKYARSIREQEEAAIETAKLLGEEEEEDPPKDSEALDPTNPR